MSEDPVVEKINKIREAGLEKLMMGSFAPYRFPDLSERYIVAYLINRHQADIGGLIRFIRDSAERCDIEILLANHAYPSHVTLLEACIRDGAPTFGNLDGCVPGCRFEGSHRFSEVVFDGASVLLMSRFVPGWVVAHRRDLADGYTRAGATPLPMEFIFHSTLCRVTKGSIGNVRAFIRYLEMLRGALVEIPVVVGQDEISLFKGPTTKLLRV